MTDTGSPDGSLHRRIIDELREFSVIAAYLCVCFTALAYLKAAILARLIHDDGDLKLADVAQAVDLT